MRVGAFAALLSATVLLAGCTGSNGGASDPGGNSPGASDPNASAPAVDLSCPLTADEVSTAVGTTFSATGESQADDGGQSVLSCEFTSTTEIPRLLVVGVTPGSAGLYDTFVAGQAESFGTDSKPVDGLGSRADFFQDDISGNLYVLAEDGTMYTFILDVFDAAPAESVMTALGTAALD